MYFESIESALIHCLYHLHIIRISSSYYPHSIPILSQCYLAIDFGSILDPPGGAKSAQTQRSGLKIQLLGHIAFGSDFGSIFIGFGIEFATSFGPILYEHFAAIFQNCKARSQASSNNFPEHLDQQNARKRSNEHDRDKEYS